MRHKKKTDHDRKMDLLVDDVIDYVASVTDEVAGCDPPGGCHPKRVELGLSREDYERACVMAREVLKQLVRNRRAVRKNAAAGGAAMTRRSS